MLRVSQIQMQQSTRTIKGIHTNYTIAELIGEGQFGKVYRATTRHTQLKPNSQKTQQVAIKVIRRNKFARNDKLKHLLEREMQVLSEFQHPHVIQLIELVVEKQDVYLVYEYCEGGTLEDRITMEEHQFMAYFGQIIEALCRAEAKNIMHRDIKPANILFKDGKIKVADWGFSRLLQFGETTCSFIGSPAYMAPEVLKGEEYSLKADVWSLGIVAYECLFGVCPWSSKSIAALSNEISRKALHLPQERGISKTTQKILSSMLNADPLGRPTFKEIRNMLNVKVMSSPKLSRSEAVLSCKQSRQSEQQLQIVSCVFLLELIQWSRKNIESHRSLLIYVRLIEHNLQRMKSHLKKDSEIRAVWQKQLKVITDMKRKLKLKIAREVEVNFCKTETSSREVQLKYEEEAQLNPEGEWESLVKEAIKSAIGQLEQAYQEGKDKKKERTLVNINVLLDLVLYSSQPQNYLKVSFNVYNRDLLCSSTKVLLQLINSKLVKINGIYY